MTMETVIFVADHRNQYHRRVRSPRPARFRSFSGRNFRGINSRTFQSDAKEVISRHVAKGVSHLSSRSANSPSSPSPRQTPSQSCDSHSVVETPSKRDIRSSPIPTTENVHKNHKHLSEEQNIQTRSFSYSEHWAGPAYSSSPPPSSLPMPKFSLWSKRTLSLNLPASKPMIEIEPKAKSAPTSPTRAHNPSVKELFLTPDCATKTLRRILNLDDPED